MLFLFMVIEAIRVLFTDWSYDSGTIAPGWLKWLKWLQWLKWLAYSLTWPLPGAAAHTE